MKSLFNKTLIAVSLVTLITACGGSGGGDTKTETSTTPPPAPTPVELTKISGMAIDGYLVGATMFMDLNFNGVLDDGEPNVVTVDPADTGDDASKLSSWTIEIPEVHEDCGQYVPMVVHVPVGAIDLDKPDEPITEAYDIVYPPSFAVATDSDLYNITPLTTIIWNEVEKELKRNETTLSCESIIAEQQLRKVIDQRLRDQEKRVAQRYNVTVDSLYSDFVADENATLHGLAQSLVPGLAKSYSETVAIEAANPNAAYAYVEYYLEGSWNRLQYIKASEGNWDEQTNSVSSDLNSVGGLVSRYQQRTTNQSGLEVQTNIGLANNVCTLTENFTEINGGVGYGLANVAGAVDVSWSACVGIDRVAMNTSQQFITKTFYSDGSTVKTESMHNYGVDNEFRYNDLIGASASELSGGWLSSNMSHISLSFEDDYGYDADTWVRLNNVYSTEVFWEADQTVHMHNSDDVYEVTTYFNNGTQSKQCGTWSGGSGSLTGC